MLHRVGALFFLVAIISIFLKYFKFIDKKISTKLHFITGLISALAMIIYSFLDFLKNKESTILLVGIASILIIFSGTNKIRKRYKWMHLTSVVGFSLALAFHIVI